MSSKICTTRRRRVSATTQDSANLNNNDNGLDGGLDNNKSCYSQFLDFNNTTNNINNNNNNNNNDFPYLCFPSLQSVRQLDYVRKLECELDTLQGAFLNLTTQYARMQFRLRQIMQATPEERDQLLSELEKFAFTGICKNKDELPPMKCDLRSMGDVRRKQSLVIEKLRSQLVTLAEASNIEALEGKGLTASGKFPVPTKQELRDSYAMSMCMNKQPSEISHQSCSSQYPEMTSISTVRYNETCTSILSMRSEERNSEGKDNDYDKALSLTKSRDGNSKILSRSSR